MNAGERVFIAVLFFASGASSTWLYKRGREFVYRQVPIEVIAEGPAGCKAIVRYGVGLRHEMSTLLPERGRASIGPSELVQ